MKIINYDGICFNADWIATKTEKELLEEGKINTHWFEGDPKKVDKLKEVYAMATGKTQAPAPAESAK